MGCKWLKSVGETYAFAISEFFYWVRNDSRGFSHGRVTMVGRDRVVTLPTSLSALVGSDFQALWLV